MRFSLLLLLFNAAVLALLLQASWARAIQTRSLAAAPNKRIAAGWAHFNYIQDNGQVFSWGYSAGLGAGNIPNSAFPVQMFGVSAASDVAGGELHACVVDGGAAKCCGWGSAGQLGNGTYDDSFTVVQVHGLSAGVKQVVAGHFYSCAVLTTGGMRCWGNNMFGQLGDGSNVNAYVPVPMTNYADSGVHSACTGWEHTCILTTGGAALCTGRSTWGQLGNNGTDDKNVMTQVIGLTDGTVTQISCGNHHTCAVTSTGGVACFGSHQYDSLGAKYWSYQLTPVYPASLQAGVSTVVAGYYSTCVIDNPARTARCFGVQDFGQFANSTKKSNQFSPVVFGGGIAGIVDMAINYYAICLLDQLGGVQCVGKNEYFQLGSGSNQTEQRDTLDYVVGYVMTAAPTTLPPTTLAPSSAPTAPTLAPTSSPTAPTLAPTPSPTIPTSAPTSSPTIPTSVPTSSPTIPTSAPTSSPTITTSSPTVTTSSPTAMTSAPTATTSSPTSAANLLLPPAAGYTALFLAAMLA